MYKDIYNSKGEIHNSCPHIDNIIELCDEQEKIIAEIKNELEKVRKINEELRNNNPKIEEAKQEVWDDISGLVGIRRCDFGDLEKFVKDLEKSIDGLENKVEKLEIENWDLLSKLKGFDDV